MYLVCLCFICIINIVHVLLVNILSVYIIYCLIYFIYTNLKSNIAENKSESLYMKEPKHRLHIIYFNVLNHLEFMYLILLY